MPVDVLLEPFADEGHPILGYVRRCASVGYSPTVRDASKILKMRQAAVIRAANAAGLLIATTYSDHGQRVPYAAVGDYVLYDLSPQSDVEPLRT